jgi:phosphoglucomutase
MPRIRMSGKISYYKGSLRYMNKRDMILDKSDHSQLTSPYHRWLLKTEKNQLTDPDVVRELREMKDDKKRIEEVFYRELTFGTGGLRGIIGAGVSRMNVHTVARASQGLADYVLKERGNAMESLETKAEGCRIAVSYDSRIKSRLFAEVACRVFAANGMKACLYPELMPTPCLSFAVRRLGCDAGVMVTASHNPKEYNGYKVYGPDGCQITVEAAEAIPGNHKTGYVRRHQADGF